MVATKTKLELAKEAAKFHYSLDDDLRHIFLLGPLCEDDPEEPVKLLEVRDFAVESGLMPVAFPPGSERGFPFWLYIAELSPREFQKIDPTNIPFRGETWTIIEELPR